MKIKNIITLLSILIFIFALFLHIYDMIVHNKLRMLCRSTGSSNIIALSWIFIVTIILLIISHNNHFNMLTLFIIFIFYILLTMFSILDYKHRLKEKNIWKIPHYLLSVIMLVSLPYGVYKIKSVYFPYVLFLFCMFISCHISNDDIINTKISIILELKLVYTSIFLLLLKTYHNLSNDYV